MTEYNAGKARATYELDLTPLRQSVAEAKRLYRELAQATQLPPAQVGEPRGTQTTVPRSEAPNARPVGRSPDPAAQAQRAEAALLRQARAEATLAQAQGDGARAATILGTALTKVDRSSVAAIQTQTQLARATTRLETAASGAAGRLQVLPRTIAGLSDGAAQFAQIAGVGFGLGALVQGVAGAAQAANALEKTSATVRAVAGSQERYNQVVKIAEANQRLFGGSLNDNLGPLQQFLFISNRSGASLDELNRVAQLLATVNPAEGIAGAGFALSEAFSGDLTSIVERFNLPRAAVRQLLAEAKGADDVLAGVTQLLATQGVTSETLAASLNTNAQSYTNLGAQASQAYTTIGAAASSAARPVADFVAAGLEGFNRIASAGQQVQGVGVQVLAAATSFDDYTAKAAAANQQLNTLGASISPLTAAQYAYAQSLMASGTSATDAQAKAEALGGVLIQTGSVQEALAARQDASAASAQALSDTMIALASTSAENNAAVFDLQQSYLTGQISAQQLADSVQQLLGAQRAQAQATAEASREAERNAQLVASGGDAARQAAEASNADAVAKIEQSTQTALASARQDELQAALERAAAGSGSAEAAAAQLAAVYQGTSVPALIEVIGLLREKAALEGSAPARPPAAVDRDVAADRAEFGAQAQRNAAAREQAAAVAKQKAYERDVANEITRATGSTRQRLALVQQELAAAPQGSEQRKQLLVEEARLRQQLDQDGARAATSAAKTRTSAAKAATKDDTAAAKAYEAEYQAARDAAQKIENLQRDHLATLARMSEDYALSQGRGEEDHQRQRQRLLAEGKIKEAQLLDEEYALKKKRDAEDQAVAVRRQQEQGQGQIAEAQTKAAQDAQDRAAQRQASGQALPTDAALRTQDRPAPATVQLSPAAQAELAQAKAAVPAPGPLPFAPGAQAQAQAALTAAQAPPVPVPIQLQIQIAPTSVQIDGHNIVELTWPAISQRVDAELSGGILNVALTAAPAVQSGGAGGPTP